MNLVLLSGGSGQRLWPLSNDIRSKQFIKIFHREDGESESMVQHVHRQIKAVDTDATVTIATSKSQVSAIHNQLGEEVGISVEPCRRDTFPAIALAAAYLKDVQGVGEEESVVVCPVDPYVENDYFEALKALGDRAAVSSANLVLMGIEPTYPSEKYGYIIPIGKEQVSKVSMFKEKPTQEVAKDYIAKGALWNGGVFAFKLGYVLNRAHELIDFVDYEDLFNKYDTLNKISFDYAVVEHEPEIEVMRFAGTWKDLGTWNTLTEAMDSHAVGEAMFNEKCENVHVVNELDVPILCMGLKDVVVSASPEGILVSDKEQSSYIKPYVNTLDHRVMFAEKSWGSFKVIDIDKASMTIKVTLNAGHQMNYHSHQHRDEVWTVIAGEGKTIVDGMEQNVKAGDVITMSAGCRHTVIAEESYGYLTGSYVRDKDGVDGAYMICEMFSYYATKGISLLDKLEELYKTYGYCLNTLHSYEFDGSAGFAKMQSIMQAFRGDIKVFGGKKVVKLLDYAPGLDGLPKSDVLKFLLEDNCSIVVRPSGTEPKLKTYISVSAEDKEAAEKVEAEICKSAEKYLK